MRGWSKAILQEEKGAREAREKDREGGDAVEQDSHGETEKSEQDSCGFFTWISALCVL